MMNDKQEAVTVSTMGLTKYVQLMFFVGTIVTGWLFANIAETIWMSLNLAFASVPPPGNWGGIVIGGGGAVGLALYLWRHPKVNRLSVEIVSELAKVSWPTRKELWASTVVVIILSIIAAIILGLFDFFWAWFTDLFYN
jgi:preprotein translocase SecE subunit